MSDARPLPVIEILYTNWRGETRWREVAPICMHFGSTEWHTEPQWLLTAFDVTKAAFRDFAMQDVARWGRGETASPCNFCGDAPATWVCQNCGNKDGAMDDS